MIATHAFTRLMKHVLVMGPSTRSPPPVYLKLQIKLCEQHAFQVVNKMYNSSLMLVPFLRCLFFTYPSFGFDPASPSSLVFSAFLFVFSLVTLWHIDQCMSGHMRSHILRQ